MAVRALRTGVPEVKNRSTRHQSSMKMRATFLFTNADKNYDRPTKISPDFPVVSKGEQCNSFAWLDCQTEETLKS